MENKSVLRRSPWQNVKHGLLIFFRWFLIIFFAVYTLFPLLWLVISSFKTNYELLTDPFSLPAVWQIGNYINALTVAGLGRMLINSVLVGLGATALNVIIASMSAYCISRFRFKGREKFYGLFTAGILIPLNALMVPYFVIINKLGLYDTYGGMILLYTAIGIPMSTFLIRGLMDSIPMELEEAAYIDGCGFFARFWHIILPLSRTGIVTAATFEFLTCWNEFVFANLIVSSEKLRTIQVGIRYFTNQFSTDYVSMYAAIVISIIPSILGYVLFQEQIISGMTSGAVIINAKPLEPRKRPKRTITTAAMVPRIAAAVAAQAAAAAFWNMGENCTANSRIIVPRKRKDAFTEALLAELENWRIGDPLDPENNLGSIVSEGQFRTIMGYIEKGKAEGGHVLTGGAPLAIGSGLFIPPTIFDGVTPDMTIVREEIFGPVTAILPADSDEEAVGLANATAYGLQATLFTEDVTKAHKYARALKAGTVSVNCFSEGDNTTPFGGYKLSGFGGKDKGRESHDQYTETKTIFLNLDR